MRPRIFKARATGSHHLVTGGAAGALANLAHGERRLIATKGQFSLADFTMAMLDVTGPAHLALMTWAVNPAELAPMIQAAATGRILSWRLLTDGDFLDLNTDGKRTSKKAQERAEQLRALTDVVLTRNHAKAAIVANAEWSLVATGSMNLTRNPRLELIEVEDSPERAAFLLALIEDMRATCGAGSSVEWSREEVGERFRRWRDPWRPRPHIPGAIEW